MVELTEARERTAHLHPLFEEAHHAAAERWKELLTDSPHLAVPLNATARANFIHPHICKEVELRVGGVPKVEVTEALGFFALRVEDDLLIRFKHLRDGRPSNVRTRQQRYLARQIYTQEMIESIGGDPALKAPTLLTVGHTLEGAEIQRIEIRCDCKDRLPWSFDIYGGESIIEPIILGGMGEDTRPAVVVTAKGQRKDEGNTAANA